MERIFNSKKYSPIIITVDGTAASGKGTLVDGAKDYLDDRYKTLDAGAMYRALTFHFLSKKIKPENLPKSKKSLLELLQNEVIIGYDNEKEKVILNYMILEGRTIRTPEIGEWVSKYSQIDTIKEYIIGIQKKIIKESDCGWILDGRCMGTSVAPQAQAKFYVDTKVETRAGRRHRQFEEDGITNISEEMVLEQLLIRDEDDKNAKIAPLIRPQDAVYIDSRIYSKDEVLIVAIGHITKQIIDNHKRTSNF